MIFLNRCVEGRDLSRAEFSRAQIGRLSVIDFFQNWPVRAWERAPEKVSLSLLGYLRAIVSLSDSSESLASPDILTFLVRKATLCFPAEISIWFTNTFSKELLICLAKLLFYIEVMTCLTKQLCCSKWIFTVVSQNQLFSVETLTCLRNTYLGVFFRNVNILVNSREIWKTWVPEKHKQWLRINRVCFLYRKSIVCFLRNPVFYWNPCFLFFCRKSIVSDDHGIL